MGRYLAASLVLVAAALLLGRPEHAPHGPPALAAPEMQAGTWAEPFNGSPLAPAPLRPLLGAQPKWDVQIHSRDADTVYQLTDMAAGHAHDCAPPPATHPRGRDYESAVFLCRDHLMTAINEAGYGVIYLTPSALLDWSAGEAVLRWEMSTLRTSGRDWVDIRLAPFDGNLALPLEAFMPDLGGEPPHQLKVKMDAFNGCTAWNVSARRNGTAQDLGAAYWRCWRQWLTESATVREQFELRVSRTHVKFGMPAYNQWWIDKAITPLAFDRATVAIGHHSYTPSKDCPAGQTCGPNTWHWDNVSLAPAVPFAMQRTDRRFADAATPTLTFAPAPPNSYLRFSARGHLLELSWDGGATWQTATKVSPSGSGDKFLSYFHSLPVDATSVRFRAQASWWSAPVWMVKDALVWTRPAGAP